MLLAARVAWCMIKLDRCLGPSPDDAPSPDPMTTVHQRHGSHDEHRPVPVRCPGDLGPRETTFSRLMREGDIAARHTRGSELFFLAICLAATNPSGWDARPDPKHSHLAAKGMT